MELYIDSDDEEPKEEPRAEEDYDPKMLEEMKERAEPRLNQVGGVLPELTITLASLTQYCKPSKMFIDAIEADGGLDFEEMEADLISQMSEEVVDKSYAYGNVGVRMQKRIPLR